MYASHFCLASEPFGLTPDPSRLYLGGEHREALAALRYGLVGRRGFVTLIGEVGTGKTTLVYELLSGLHGDLRAAYVGYTRQDFRDLLVVALRDLGLSVPEDASKAALVRALHAHLLAQAETGGSTALVIDEAQNLSVDAFEELRLLSNCETYSEKLLQIVLVGQPELYDRLAQPELRQLRERVAVRAVIHPLRRGEMRRYLEHRVRMAGGTDLERLFTPGAVRLIVARAAGIPRRANILCHNALLFAYGRDLPRVTRSIAMEAAAEMRGLMPGSGVLGRLVPSLRERRAWAVAAAVGVVVSAVSLSGHARHERPESPVAARAAYEVAEVAAPIVLAKTEVPSPPVTAPAEPPADVAVEAPAAPARAEATAPSDDSERGGSITIMLSVPRGATLERLAYRLYGSDLAGRTLPQVFADVQRLNPGLDDVGRIMAGERLRFPFVASMREMPVMEP